MKIVRALLFVFIVPTVCCAAQSAEMPAAPAKKSPPKPQPRAVAVLEWLPTAAPEKKPATNAAPVAAVKAVPAAKAEAPSKDDVPKEARLVPVSIFYQGAFQDAGVYLSRPTPLALQADTVYELEKAGDDAGTFTVHSTSRSQDAWIAFGDYKPVPPVKPVVPNVNIALGSSVEDEDSDRPVLRRRHSTPETTPAKASAPTPAKSSTPDSQPIGADDADRPKLKRNDAAAPAAAAPAPSATSTTKAASSELEPKTSDNYLNPADDASRPRIKRGIYNEAAPALPTLFGNPSNLRQTVAVSDAMHTDDHPFAHQWNDDAERQRAQQAMQDLALKQIAAWQKSQPKSAVPPTAGNTKRPATRKSVGAAQQQSATQSLAAVQFAGYDLAYQDEPTYVFVAQTATTGAAQIFVAVVARPDIYGNLQVVFSAVTSGEELALTPRYRLVDAVDAQGEGRADLLLESRNLDGRRFVLLDVYRGVAQKVFETGILP